MSQHERQPDSLIEFQRLERRDWELWILTLFLLVVLATFIVVTVFYIDFHSTERTDSNSDYFVNILFVGLTALLLLFFAYVMFKEHSIKRVYRALVHEKLQFEKLATRLKDVETLFTISSTVNSGRNLPEILDTIVRTVADHLGCDQASVFLFNQDSNLLECQAAYGYTSTFPRTQTIELGKGIAGWVVKEGKPLLLTGKIDEGQFDSFIEKDRPIRSAMCIPLRSQNRTIGVFNVNRTTSAGNFTEVDLKIVSIFADNAAGALEAQRLLDRVRESEAYYRSVVNHSADSIVIIDPLGNVTSWNASAERIYGWKADEMVGRPLLTIPPERAEEMRLLIEALNQGQAFTCIETVRVRKDGTRLSVSLTLSPIYDAQENVIGFCSISRDITPWRTMEEQLKTLSITDHLTGLYNSRYFYETLEREIHRASRHKSPLSLLMIDLDHFKAYNDMFGHLRGDDVLRQVGEVLQSSFREDGDFACRYGGDEFTCILTNTLEKEASMVAERIRTGIESLKLERVSLSIGVAQLGPGNDLTSLIARADRLMYLAKHRGGNCVVDSHAPELQEGSEEILTRGRNG